MGRGFEKAIILVWAAVAPVCAGAVSATGHLPQQRCEVANAGTLPAGPGGATAICAEIERAISASAPTARYKVEVKVLSRSRLSAIAVVNRRTLPEQNFAVMDQELNAGSIRRFAEALAGEVAKAAKE